MEFAPYYHDRSAGLGFAPDNQAQDACVHSGGTRRPGGMIAVLSWIWSWLHLWANKCEYVAPPNPEDIYEPNRAWRRLNKHKTPAAYNLKPFYVIFGRDLTAHQFLTRVERVSGMGRVLVFMLYPKRATRFAMALARYQQKQHLAYHLGTIIYASLLAPMGHVGLGLWAAHLWPK